MIVEWVGYGLCLFGVEICYIGNKFGGYYVFGCVECGDVVE